MLEKLTRCRSELFMLGMAIGLPIRKAVVDTHKGRIGAHNADGRQATEPLAPEIGRKLSHNNFTF
ncbi:hypothetical protein RAE19_12690 [Rhodoferax sp. TBRC 17660]|uniref:Uncharacterized protein n=1 Tax=Rhodoferax potami TaxID=3068338 RepID=A0ABU3KP84_9BURK|nr:hypothetical protein [Rhodoferax sp. TBRC 17660]MDT7519556.1 hypothetical protein [Rhodoferax sp. TBRC 17660]